MAFTRTPDTADLMLALLERTSHETASRQRLTNALRRDFPISRLKARVKLALDALEAEGLVEAARSGDEIVFSATPLGLEQLERRGLRPSEATVLFTDLVGSTELIANLGEDEAHACRVRHFALLKACVERTHGRVVKNLGDGLMVLHNDSREALECARQMQQAVAADSDDLGLRVGVHRGEVLRDGDDCFGMTVVVATRLCDTADAGQIVVSDAVLEDQPAKPLGLVGLKGVPMPIAANALEWSSPSAARA